MTASIEARSFEILARRADLSAYAPAAAAVVARVIHASADLDYQETMVVDSAAVAAGCSAIAAGCAVVADVEMVRCGITGVHACCHLNEGEPPGGLTRSAAGIREAVDAHPSGAVFVIGCAPTALAELVELHRAGAVVPALVIGLPVGFVGAADSKEALRASGLPSISNVGEKGGSAVAAAAVNAIVRLATRV